MVTVGELKAHLRIDSDEEDNYLQSLLWMAQSICEDFTFRTFESPPPEPVRLAVLLVASHFYTYREAVNSANYEATMTAVHRLLWPYRDESKLF